MNKTAIRNYAVWARTALIEAVTQKAFEYEIKDGAEMNGSLESIGGRLLTKEEKEWRKKLIDEIKHKNFNQVMEEAAYTWFNRFIALRYMEVNGFIPSRVRVFTNEAGEFKPDILKEAMAVELEGLNREKVIDLIEKQNNEELFKYLIITQCNALNQGLPYMFEKISNWTELLFPVNLLRSDSIIGRMVNDIPEEDWKDAVQIIGWMYQYYNTELKDEIDRVQGSIKIKKTQIPAATQIFTPDWIVRYMVENSLGKLWLEGHPDVSLKSNWNYYLDESEQEAEVEAQLQRVKAEYANIKPEDIKIIDPCMGSGHILVYAFDVLMQIYTANGYSERDAAKSILENNLYGLDIDDRAGQLAYFAVMMKARKYSRRILNAEIIPNVFSIQESSFMSDDFIMFVANKDHELELDLIGIRNIFVDAKEYGSILSVPKFDFAKLYARIEVLKAYFPQSIFEISYRELAIEKLYQLVKQAEMMHQKYDVTVTNPPYMGSRLLNDNLRQFMANNYPDAKTDTYATFILRCIGFKKKNGFVGMMTPNTWLTINSYKRLREHIVAGRYLSSMILLSSEAFNDAGVVINAFVLKADVSKTIFCDLQMFDEERLSQKLEIAMQGKVSYRDVGVFLKLPNTVIDPSFSNNMINVISENKNVHTVMQSDGQTKTGDNDKYLRMLWEVENSKVGSVGQRWCLHAKGGGYRKWYGNVDTVIDWSPEAKMFYRKDRVARITPEYLWYKEGITWSLISGQHNSFRILPESYTFNCAAPTVFFADRKKEYFVLGLLNTNFAQNLLRKYNATINLTIDDVGSIPYFNTPSIEDEVVQIVECCIQTSADDWDSFETSWDFKKHPLVPYAPITDKIELAYEYWEKKSLERFIKLKENEEELNRIFIDIYGLQDELNPEVEEKDVTVRKADLQREVKSLISYAIGVIFGRYSLDIEGLAFAGGEWDSSKYKTIIPDADNILPICDDDYFEDDLTGKVIKFIEVVYGKETLEENLRFIADALGGKGTSREVIRNYLLNGFYADHLKIYQKRPIYWQFSSGKKNGFKALCYMHRYQPDLLARMRTDYVHEQQERYRTQLTMLEESVDSAAPSEKVKINKQIAKLREQALEIQKFEEKVHHLADQMISIDLDDGVKVNYEKFAEVLEKIK